MRKHENKCRVYVGFMDLGQMYDRVTKTPWQVLRMYDVGGKLLNGIMSMHNSLACVIRVKGNESN